MHFLQHNFVSMNSRRMKKMAKQVSQLVKTHEASEKYSLISTEQPLSDTDNNHSAGIIQKGFVAVYVGPHDRRFVIPTRYLSVPEFKAVMEMAAEEFGYEQEGGLRIPCDEDDFQNLLAVCKLKLKSKSKSRPASFNFHNDHCSHAIHI